MGHYDKQREAQINAERQEREDKEKLYTMAGPANPQKIWGWINLNKEFEELKKELDFIKNRLKEWNIL